MAIGSSSGGAADGYRKSRQRSSEKTREEVGAGRNFPPASLEPEAPADWKESEGSMSRTRRKPPGRDREPRKGREGRGGVPARRPAKDERAREELEWDEDEVVDDEDELDIEDPSESLEDGDLDVRIDEGSWDDDEPTERSG
jgi:hypothetical protein